MSSYKRKLFEMTVSAVGSAVENLVELGTECREIVDNASDASEGLSQTPRIQTLDATASELEDLSEPDVPGAVEDLGFKAFMMEQRRKGRGESRSVRCANEVAVLRGAVDALEEWLGENEEHADKDEVSSLKDELETIVGTCEGLEFPGMFG